MGTNALHLLKQIEDIRLKHLAGRHDQKSHAPHSVEARPIPKDVVMFSGNLYHVTGTDTAPSISAEGLRPGVAERGEIADAVYFSRTENARQGARGSGAEFRLSLSNARLAPRAGILMDIHDEVRSELRSRISVATSKRDRDAIREQLYSDYPYTEAIKRYTALGYDGYEQGFDTVAITNPAILISSNLTRIKQSTYTAPIMSYNESRERGQIADVYTYPYDGQTIGTWLDKRGVERTDQGMYVFYIAIREDSHGVDHGQELESKPEDVKLDKSERVCRLELRPTQIDGNEKAILREDLRW